MNGTAIHFSANNSGIVGITGFTSRIFVPIGGVVNNDGTISDRTFQNRTKHTDIFIIARGGPARLAGGNGDGLTVAVYRAGEGCAFIATSSRPGDIGRKIIGIRTAGTNGVLKRVGAADRRAAGRICVGFFKNRLGCVKKNRGKRNEKQASKHCRKKDDRD